MIVLPLNEQARSSRRPPWVTLALLVACVAVFLHFRGADATVDERTAVALDEAWSHFVAHPYVKMDDDVAVMLGADEVAKVRNAFLTELHASGSPGIPDFVRHHDQVDFDALVDEVYRELERHSFQRLGFFPESLSEPGPSWWTYVLVHEDWLHLVPNLLVILLAGLFLEEVWGRVFFLGFLLTAAVAGAAGYALLDPHAVGVLGGASGVGAALAGAFLIRFAAVPIRFQYFVIPPFGGKFTAPGWITLPLYGGLYLAADYLLTHGVPGMEPVGGELSTWTHVGGFVWGVVFATGMGVLRIEQRFVRPSIERKLLTHSNPVLDRALEAREAGRVEEAVEMLAGEVARRPRNHDACLAYWDAANAAGRPEQAAEAVVRVLRDEVAGGRRELAIQHWRELSQRAPDHVVEAGLELKLAGLLLEAGEHDLATFSLRRILDGSCGEVKGATAHRVARLAQDLDTGVALEAAARALTAGDLDPAERGEVERLQRQLTGVSQREAADREASAHERSGPFESGFDFTEGADGRDPDGDSLNAEPFELDEAPGPGATQPPAGAAEVFDPNAHDLAESAPDLAAEGSDQSLDLAADGSGDALDLAADGSGDALDLAADGSGDALDLAASSPDLAGAPDSGLDLAAEAPDSGLDLAAEAPDAGLDLAAEAPDAGLDLAAEAPGDAASPAAGSVGPDLDATLPPSLDAVPGDLDVTLPPSLDDDASDPDLTVPPALEPGDADLGLTLPPTPAGADDAGASDPGHTIELESLGAETIQGQTLDLASLGARTIQAEALDLGPPEAPPAAAAPRSLKRMDAIPLALGDAALTLDVGERGKAQLALERIDAIAVAGVRGLRPKPVVVIDLVANWLAAGDQPLKIVRLRSDRFDPRKLVDGEENGFRALKRWIAELIERSDAMALPDRSSAVGQPFRMFESLEGYEREVLRIL